MEPYPGVHDMWGLQEDIRILKIAQFENAERLSQHSERIGKLEGRHDDSRIRSLWGAPGPSPFPAPLSSFTQQPNPPEQPSNFGNGFDSQQNLVLSGLQLDEVDVPRRGASRANSVRFDDSATTNHWIHDNSPGASDYFGGHRSSSNVGGYPMTERSSSHKSDQRSDGRQSSMRSFGGVDLTHSFEGENGNFHASGQVNDILDSCLHPAITATGSAPAIVRCWLNSASFEPLLYAVVCTGSARSSVEMSLITRLGLQDLIEQREKEAHIRLTVFLADAISQQRTGATGPPKMIRVAVDFVVLSSRHQTNANDEIGIFLGSDFLSSYTVDVLFSERHLLLHVDDGRKVFVPFRRPDSEKKFSDIYTMHAEEFPQEKWNDRTRWATPPIGAKLQMEDQGLSNNFQRPHPPVSSPRPVQGQQASVIRSVASMGSPDFPPRDPNQKTTITAGQNGTNYQHSDRNRPWTTPAGRKESFGSEISHEPPRNMDDGGDLRDSTNTYDDSKSEGEGMTRGRSLTNPYAPLNDHALKTPGGNVWAGRKSSLTNPIGSKDINSGGSSQHRVPSRGMKVLRTSKSFSSSEKANTQQNSNGGGNGEPSSSSTVSSGPNKHSVLTTPKSKGHTRAMSGDAGSMTPKGALVRPKSSNVVGGATAFHWMTPKTSVGDH
ncbi:hypothetical protein EDC01DRAFT_291837 [Geopyxis carbonaria]|nr:hypothetical protein EDC01DRAFT_291837 [Geopyxis carbonaria]